MSIASLYPSINPSLLLDFANSKVLDPRITFTRTTTATYYDGVTTAKAEENMLINSTGNGTNSVSVTLTTSATTAPDGTSTAVKLTPTATNDRHIIYQYNATGTYGSGLPITASAFVKAGGYNYAQLGHFQDSSGANGGIIVDLTNGSITTVAGNLASYSATLVGNGWYRLVITFVATFSIGTGIIVAASNSGTPATTAGSPLFTGDGTSAIYFWGIQMEQRSSATAYTATTTQAITNYIPVLQTAAAGQARFDHNPTTGESLGLLIEEQRTNLVVYSSDFANANWIQYNGGVITSNQMIAPDGTLTADQMVMTSTQYSGVYQSGPAGATGTCTISVWARTATGTQTFNIGFYNGIQGAVMSPNLTATTSWQRFTFTATLSGVSNIHINNYTASAGTIFIWGAQVEAGSFATSYIPTVASSVTRNADVASMTGTNFSSWFNNSEGTLFANFKTSVATNYPQAAFISDGTSNNCINIDAQSGLRSIVTTLGATTAFFSASKSGSGDLVTLAYKVNDFGSSFNGAAAGTDTSGNVPVVSQFGIGQSYSNLNLLNGTIKKISYYPIKATSAQLQALTV